MSSNASTRQMVKVYNIINSTCSNNSRFPRIIIICLIANTVGGYRAVASLKLHQPPSVLYWGRAKFKGTSWRGRARERKRVCRLWTGFRWLCRNVGRANQIAEVMWFCTNTILWCHAWVTCINSNSKSSLRNTHSIVKRNPVQSLHTLLLSLSRPLARPQ